MSLYGRSDTAANKTKAERVRGNGAGSATETIVFCDGTEASLAQNKKRGITGPGWWSYRTYTDVSGATRHKAEQLAFISNPDTVDTADDTILADVASTITITTQPTNQTTASGGATFTVAATATVGSVTFQWQKRTTSGGRFSNVSGATSASLVLTGQTAAASGNEYRVKLNSTAGATEVISDEVTLTFGT